MHRISAEILVSPGNIIVNPGANVVLVQSSALAAGLYSSHIIVYASAAMDIILERRDATNSTNIWSQYIRINGGFYQNTIDLTVVQNETIRIETLSGNTGTFQASLFNTRLL